MGRPASPEVVALGRDLWAAAEGGFLERRTQEILACAFEGLGFVVQKFTGMPGFAASVDGGRGGKTTAVLADMDALPTGESSPGGGPAYAHLCGHHQQMTVLYGAARILEQEAPALLPRLLFVAAPAEEFVELERREVLRRGGAVTRLSGKQELIGRGFFHGLRRAVATHAAHLPGPASVNSVLAMNGFDVLAFSFRGKSSHAGAAPHLGRNAQNAASLFLQACAFLREGFDEEKHIRIHPVLRLRPDQPVNLVPDAALVETYARGIDPGSVEETVRRLSAAAEGCAAALGTTVEARLVSGYAPFAVDPGLHEALRQTAAARGFAFVEDRFSAASSDMGDVSQILPSIIVGLPGSNGLLHQAGFAVTDEQAAYAGSSEILAAFLVKVLSAD